MRATWEMGAGRHVFVCFISAYAPKTQIMKRLDDVFIHEYFILVIV